MRRTRASRQSRHQKFGGYRSGFEQKIAGELKAKGIKFEYEPWPLKYLADITNGYCPDCRSTHVQKERTYSPDFVIPSTNGVTWILETKGRLTMEDRAKMKYVVDQWQDMYTFVLVFQRMNYLTTTKATSYADWCERNNIMWTVGLDKGLVRRLREIQR